MMYKRDIGNKIYKQMLQHFYCENGFLQEEVVGTRDYNLQQSYSCAERVNLFSDDYTGNIQSVLFEGVKRGVFSAAKFDSRPELVLARVLETDTDVQNWLRPAPQEFNITYNHGHNYEPDFVVETDDTIYLVEVKGEDKLSDPDVIAKKSAVSNTARLPLTGARQTAINSGGICLSRPSRSCRTRRLCSWH